MFKRKFHGRLGTAAQVEQRRTLRLAVETYHVDFRRGEILAQRNAGPMPRDPQSETAGGRDGGNQTDPQHIAACVAKHLPIQARGWFVGVAAPRCLGQFRRCGQRDGLDGINEPAWRDASRQVEGFATPHPHVACRAAHHHPRRQIDRRDTHHVQIGGAGQQRQRDDRPWRLLLHEQPRRPDAWGRPHLLADGGGFNGGGLHGL